MMLPHRRFVHQALVLLVCWLGLSPAAQACFLSDFAVSTEPQLPAANTAFDLVLTYSASAGCVNSESLVIEQAVLRLDIDCNCALIPTGPEQVEFRSLLPGLPAGSYEVQVIDSAALPNPLTAATFQLLIGHAPSIPVSPLALTLLTLTLAGAAVWVLRR